MGQNRLSLESRYGQEVVDFLNSEIERGCGPSEISANILEKYQVEVHPDTIGGRIKTYKARKDSKPPRDKKAEAARRAERERREDGGNGLKTRKPKLKFFDAEHFTEVAISQLDRVALGPESVHALLKVQKHVENLIERCR